MGNVWRNQVNEADLDLWTFLIPKNFIIIKEKTMKMTQKNFQI